MSRTRLAAAVLAVAVHALRPAVAPAQATDTLSPDRTPRAVVVDGGGIRPLSVAKWGSLGATVAAAVYGFAASLGADDRYGRIETLCAVAERRCREHDPDGGYLDEEIDRLDREAARLDRRARIGLLASQVGVAASVALFILDLRDTGAPPNVPYEPWALRVGMGRDGGVRLGVRVLPP